VWIASTNFTAICLLTLVVAFGCSMIVYRFVPARDPVDVVGVALLSGHSERLEQLTFYTFLLTCTVVPILCLPLLKSFPRIPVIAGLFMMCLLATVPQWINPKGIFVVLASSASCLILGNRRGRERAVSPQTVILVWLLLWFLVNWLSGFIPSLLAFVFYPPILGSIFLAGVLIVFVWTRHTQFRRVLHSASDVVSRHRFVLACGCCAYVLLQLSFGYKLLFGAGAVIAILGTSFSDENRAMQYSRWEARVGLMVIATAMIAVGSRMTLHPYTWTRPIGVILTGGATGSFLVGTSDPARQVRNSLLGLWTFLVRNLPAIVVAFCLVIAITKPWFGLTMAAVLVYLLRSSRRKANWWTAVALAIVMLLVFLPKFTVPLNLNNLDIFHDGQILSAVWEFNTGKTLYTEVFPLRSFQFFVAWCGQWVLPATLESYHFIYQLISFIPVAGAVLVGFAWTRSLFWGLAAGLLISTNWMMDPRQGIHLLTAAAAIEILRRGRPARWTWLAPLGVVAGFVGFDGIAPLVFATIAAIALAPPNVPRWKPTGIRQLLKLTFRQLCHRVVWVGYAACLMLGSFTIVITVWQGSEAAREHWLIFLDFARHLNAFYGLPITFHDITHGKFTVALWILGAWIATGAICWAQFPLDKQRIWVFVGVFVALLFHRTLGREHLDCLVYPTKLLLLLMAFEIVRFLRWCGLRQTETDRRCVALAVILSCLSATPHGDGTPSNLSAAIRGLSPIETHHLNRRDFILEEVGEEETLWPIENGIANYAHRRHNPTRHAIAFAMSTPREQRLAVKAMRHSPPKLIQWKSIEIDGRPSLLRYYIIFPFIYQNYQPSEHSGYVKPANEGWNGSYELSEPFNFPLRMDYLPLMWGAYRLQDVQSRADDSHELQQPLFLPKVNNGKFDGWEFREPLESRHFNYLLLRISCTAKEDAVKPVNIIVRFAPFGSDYQPNDAATLFVKADGQLRSYLIPIGCCPGWSWRPQIESLRLDFPAEVLHSKPQGLLLRVDEITQD
jgi:hypothetical protein